MNTPFSADDLPERGELGLHASMRQVVAKTLNAVAALDPALPPTIKAMMQAVRDSDDSLAFSASVIFSGRSRHNQLAHTTDVLAVLGLSLIEDRESRDDFRKMRYAELSGIRNQEEL